MSVATFAAAQLLRVLPRVRVSRVVGRLCESPLPAPVSRAVQKAYCTAYPVDMDEAAPVAGAYPSFDAFFTRRLRDGIRALSPDSVVSPADGRLSTLGPIASDTRLSVKGQRYAVAELIGDERDAPRYRGGQFAVVYLAPSDYHRVHAPVDGAVTLVRGIPGDLFPVNRIGERHVPGLFVRNNRVAIAIDSERHGRVTAVMVGAMIVGRISVPFIKRAAVPAGSNLIEPPPRVERGDEIGIFHLGSTVVLLLEPGVTLAREPGKIRYGESLLKRS